MRRVILIVCVFSLCLVLGSCDPYSGQRPYEYDDAKWVCEDPSAWFLTDCHGISPTVSEGEMMIDDQVVQIGLYFVHQTNRIFLQIENSDDSGWKGKIIDGDCKFSPKKLIIEVQKDEIFNGKYDELVFVRTPIDTTVEETSTKP